MAREKAEALGLKPRARIYDQTTVGVDPVIMLTGPIPATQKLLERNAMAMDDIDLVEINEAFASVVAAWRRELDPTWTGSTSTAARSRSATRLARPAPG